MIGLALALLTLGGVQTAKADYNVYFKPGDAWSQANAIFKLRMYNNMQQGGKTNEDKADFTEVYSGSGVYRATFKSDYQAGIQILRCAPDGTTWNESNYFSIPTSAVCYDFSACSSVSNNERGTSFTPPTIVVAGVKEIINGTAEWASTSEANTMTANDFEYSLTISNRLLAAGTYNFKFVANSSEWIGQNGNTDNAANVVLTIAEDGVYNIAYTYNYILRGEPQAVATKVANAVTTYEYYATGSVSGDDTNAGIFGEPWARYEPNKMTWNGTTSRYELAFNRTLSTTSTSYKCKLLKYKTISYQDQSIAFAPEWIGAGEYDYTFSVDGNGYYNVLITYTTTNGISVQVDECLTNYSITFKNTPYNWNNIHAYIWCGSGANEYRFVGDWPGAVPLYENSTYTVAFSVNEYVGKVPEYVIFNNGDGGGSQTADLPFVNGKEYNNGTPSVTAKVAASGFATFSSEYALNFSNATKIKAYRATLTSDNRVLLSRVWTAPARTGLLIQGNAANAAEAIPAAIGATSLGGDNLFVATVTATTVGAGNNYVLSTKNGNTGFYQLTGDVEIPAGKAYLATGETALAANVTARSAWLFEGDDATGINAALTNIESGDNTVYNLNGQRVAQPGKGLYIINGKKIVKK